MPNITLSILEAYYPYVSTLTAYLADIIAPTPDQELTHTLVRDTDPDVYKKFISNTYVALNAPTNEGNSDNPRQIRLMMEEPMVSMREIIDRAQRRILVLSRKKTSNVLTAGYRLSDRPEDRGKGGIRQGISNHFVNTIVTALQGSDWERLLKRTSEDIMLHLLTETIFFVPLPNDCLCQVTGAPIIYLKPPPWDIMGQARKPREGQDMKPEPGVKRKAVDPLEDTRAGKRARPVGRTVSMETSSKVPTPPLTVADISFDRSRLFYARPAFVPHTNTIVAGLPPKHVLNMLNTSFRRQQGTVVDERKQMENARHLSKYVFPRQYGLVNVFTTVNHKSLSHTDREVDIKNLGSFKTPKRVKPPLKYLEKMLWRHGKCGYKPLRDLACPSKLKREHSTPLDSSIILELMSEQSIHPPSQAPIDAGDPSNATITTLPSQKSSTKKLKPKFAEFMCTYAEVYRYAALVTRTVVPRQMWGSVHNFKTIMKSVQEIIAARRYETITLHRVLQGFRISDCSWLTEADKTTGHMPLNASLKQREILEEFLYWYFASFLLPLLRTTFYITESSAFRNRILYFRQDDWHVLCAPLIERLSAETFIKLDEAEANEILRQCKLGFSYVRLLPKETGVRPIVNLRRKAAEKKSGSGGYQQSINDVLQAAFQILTYEKNARPELVGSSVFGQTGIYEHLKDFKSRLGTIYPPGNQPELYFVKVDVQACFDTIEQTKLLQLLREVISEDNYMLPRFGHISQAAGKLKRTFVKKAVPDDEHPHFMRYVTELAAFMRHVIFVDQVIYPFSSRDQILELLEEHITENIVKIGQDYYRQVVGIPQGSVCSSLLCSLFYGDLEREHLGFTEDPESVMLRLIDDYLFITTDVAKAKKFLDVMKKGHPEYGCFISQDKTLTNFPYDDRTINVSAQSQRKFPWCGLFIDMRDLSVSTDYTRFHDTYLADSLTVDRGRRAGSAFVHKMMQLGKAKSHLLFCDTALNTPHGVYFNLYQNFLLVAMKMHRYLHSWGGRAERNPTFVCRTIQQIIRYTYATIRGRGSRLCQIASGAVFWLGTTAFHTALSRKHSAYRPVLKMLAVELRSRKNRGYEREFQTLVAEGAGLLSLLSF